MRIAAIRAARTKLTGFSVKQSPDGTRYNVSAEGWGVVARICRAHDGGWFVIGETPLDSMFPGEGAKEYVTLANAFAAFVREVL